MDILHINKPKTYYNNQKIKTKIKQRINQRQTKKN